jgi:copper chaperone CopZ
MKTLKTLMVLVIFLIPTDSRAAFVSAKIKVTGVTCSMCSNAVNKALSSLEFVEKVEVDLEEAVFNVTFKENQKVIIDQIRQKVEGAGFSIGDLVADFNFSQVQIKDDFRFEFGASSYHFVEVKEQRLEGVVALRFVDKGLTAPSNSKKYSAKAKHPCIKTGRPEDCGEGNSSLRIYHVTI